MRGGPHQRVLVIRLGALGDFVLSFPPFAAIRAHHPDAETTLLTTRPFAALAERAPWFDRVLVDARPPWWNAPGVARLAAMLRGFDMVYDLQTSARSNAYLRLAGRPPWSGIARGCSAPHANPARDAMHTVERQREQLAMAGIGDFPRPGLSWFAGPGAPEPPAPFAVLVPGAAPHRPEKRWPAEHFGALANILAGRGLLPVIVGTPGEAPLAATIRQTCPAALDLTGRTDLFALSSLFAGAALAVGNDTGPMHVATAQGCPSVVLFGPASDPALTAPRFPDGGWPVVLRAGDLAALPVARVAAALPPLR